MGVVTVWATDESGDAPVGFVLSLLSVPELGLGSVPTLYVPVNEGSGLALWTLTATGGDGSGVVFGEVADAADRVAVEGGSGRVLLSLAASSAGVETVVVGVDDGALGNATTGGVTLRFYEGLGFDENPVTVGVAESYTGVVHEVTVSGGSGSYIYLVASTVDDLGRDLQLAIDGAGRLRLGTPMAVASTVSVVVAVADVNIPSLDSGRLTVILRAGNSVAWQGINGTVLVGATVGTPVASLVLLGYSVAVVVPDVDGLFGFDSNLLELGTSPVAAGVYLATAVVSDAVYPLVGTVTAVYTLSVVNGVTGVVPPPVDPSEPGPATPDPDASDGGNRTTVVAPTFFGELLTVSLVGGVPPYGYSLVGPAAGFDVDDDGVVNVAEGGGAGGGDDDGGDGAGGGEVGELGGYDDDGDWGGGYCGCAGAAVSCGCE